MLHPLLAVGKEPVPSVCQMGSWWLPPARVPSLTEEFGIFMEGGVSVRDPEA